jgi:hypothetical protein
MPQSQQLKMNEAERRPSVLVETVRPFRELFEALQEAGFDTEHRAPFEPRSADVAEVLAIYVVEKLADPEVDRVIAAVKGWATSWLRPFLRNRGGTVVSIPIYGPKGEVLSRVDVIEDSEAPQ